MLQIAAKFLKSSKASVNAYKEGMKTNINQLLQTVNELQPSEERVSQSEETKEETKTVANSDIELNHFL